MPSNPVKDDNLRLVLAPGHEKYLSERIRERMVANAGIALIWFCIPALAEVIFFTDLFLSDSGEMNGVVRIIMLVYGSIIVLFFPIPLFVIPRNMWMARKFIGYYEDHLDFLEKYERKTGSGRRQLEQYATKFAALNGATMFVAIFLWLHTVILIFRSNSGI